MCQDVRWANPCSPAARPRPISRFASFSASVSRWFRVASRPVMIRVVVALVVQAGEAEVGQGAGAGLAEMPGDLVVAGGGDLAGPAGPGGGDTGRLRAQQLRAFLRLRPLPHRPRQPIRHAAEPTRPAAGGRGCRPGCARHIRRLRKSADGRTESRARPGPREGGRCARPGTCGTTRYRSCRADPAG